MGRGLLLLAARDRHTDRYFTSQLLGIADHSLLFTHAVSRADR
jgi:hypothetical protein